MKINLVHCNFRSLQKKILNYCIIFQKCGLQKVADATTQRGAGKHSTPSMLNL